VRLDVAGRWAGYFRNCWQLQPSRRDVSGVFGAIIMSCATLVLTFLQVWAFFTLSWDFSWMCLLDFHFKWPQFEISGRIILFQLLSSCLWMMDTVDTLGLVINSLVSLPDISRLSERLPRITLDLPGRPSAPEMRDVATDTCDLTIWSPPPSPTLLGRPTLATKAKQNDFEDFSYDQIPGERDVPFNMSSEVPFNMSSTHPEGGTSSSSVEDQLCHP